MELKDAPENKMYVIEVTNLLKKKGFVIETPNGIAIAVGGFDINIKQFETIDMARQYISDNKLYKKGSIRIVDNQEIMERYSVSPTGEVYVIQNQDEQHLFFDNKTQKYYFGDREVGCCAWFSKDDVDKFIKYRQQEMLPSIMVAVQMNDPGAEPINNNRNVN